MSPKGIQKLKDTCDICSAAKVKCEKQRPRCSRCEKLSYRCFYSAARRKGRPHPNINEDAQAAESIEPAEREPEYGYPPPGIPPGDVRGVVGPAHNTRGRNHALEQQQHQHQEWSTYPQGLIPGYQQAITPDINRTNLPLYTSGGSSTSTTGTSSPIILHTEASATAHRSNADETLHAWSATSSDSSECSDCALLAMETLQNLTLTCSEPRLQSVSSAFLSSSNQDLNRPDLDIQVHTTSTAIKRLSAILVCPCSCNLDVALINAALCAAILDSYWTILRSSMDSISQGAADVDNIMANRVGDLRNTMSLINQVISHPDNMQLGAQAQGRRDNQQVIIRRVLEELPKAANVVMQFMRRYDGTDDAAVIKDGNEDVALLLPILATAQITRLQDVVHKATNLLTLVG